ncbi:MAG: methyl-accepting chemotaxis protein [Thermoleophilia bacterium]
MQFIRHLKVGQRLMLAFGLTAAVFLTAIAVGWVKIGSVADGQREFATASSRAHAAGAAVYNMRVSQAQNVALRGRGRVLLEDGTDMHEGDVAAFEEAFAALKGAVRDDAGRAEITRIERLYADWTALDRRLQELVDGRRAAEAVSLENADVNSTGDDLAEAFTALGAREADAGAASTGDGVSTVRTLLVLLGLLALLTAIVQAILASRSITRPMNRIQEHMMSIARGGDLTARVDATRTDELGNLAHGFNALMATLHDIVRGVGESGRSLLATAAELTSTAGESERAVTEVASTVETVATASSTQAASAMRVTEEAEDMARRVGGVADGAVRLAEAAERADRTAQDGAQTVEQAARTIERVQDAVSRTAGVVEALGARSGDIGAIIATITDISAQTNLLALNAAIEAARAGDAGRGFAVVADEVRQLAESTQQQAASIAEIIGDIQRQTTHAVSTMEEGRQQVADGVRRTADAGEAFTAIRAEVERLSAEIGGVAEAAVELRSGTEVMREGIAEVAAVSEENAAAAQEVAASSAETAASAEQVGLTAEQVAETAKVMVDLVASYTVWSPGTPDKRDGMRTVDQHLERRYAELEA